MIRSTLFSLSMLAFVSVPATLVNAETFNRETFYPVEMSQTLMAQVASGNFTTVEQNHPTLGTATIVEEGEQRYLEFSDDFTTAEGPDVEVILYQGDSVPVNIAEGSYMTLAPLQSFDGAQRYAIPTHVNLDEFESVGIWCRQFNVTFGYADI